MRIQFSHSHYAAVTPSDTIAFADGECDALLVGTAGTISVVRPDGTAVAMVTSGASIILPVKAIRVNATGTAATNITALYHYKGLK